MPYCDNCGAKITEETKFCPNCGREIFMGGVPSPTSPSPPTQPFPQQPTYPPNQQYPPSAYPPSSPIYPNQPGGYISPTYINEPSGPYQPPLAGTPGQFIIAPLGDRIIAYCIDAVIIFVLSIFLYIPGIIYALLRDGINQGRSIGKKQMGLRVVRYNTGEPISYGDSCIRNFCDCCVCLAFVDNEHRHVGDYIGGTIVVKDK